VTGAYTRVNPACVSECSLICLLLGSLVVTGFRIARGLEDSPAAATGSGLGRKQIKLIPLGSADDEE
jgi:hypothetical protein